MKQVSLITVVCVIAAAAALTGSAGGASKPLPALRVSVSGWSAKKTYTVGQAVSYGFAIRNRAHVRLKLVEVRMALPKGWRLVAGTSPSPVRVKGSTAVWHYLDVGARTGSLRRLQLSFRVGGKPGSACFTQVVRGLRPATAARTTHGCNRVVDAVFH